MKTAFAILLSTIAMATTSHASLLPRDSVFCPGAVTVSTSSVEIEGKTVELANLSCGHPVNKRHAVAASTPVFASTPNVCNEPCQNACTNDGPLPPEAQDCQNIVDAINIFYGAIASTFTVAANHAQTLTFGTCRFFFENTSAKPVEYCWLSFGQVASAAGSACFPPTQPVYTEGLCVPSAAPWQVGVTHS